MQKNWISYTLLFSIIVIGALLSLSWIPEIQLGPVTFKRINLLADLQPDVQRAIPPPDTTKTKEVTPQQKKAVARECKPGITCLEDFSPDQTALSHFFTALKQSKQKAVRVAFLGDSFIEGDILTASLRDTLQSLFGGIGVGYVPITSEVAAFRTTIRHTFYDWKTYSTVGEHNEWSPLGTSGYCFVPLENNAVEYEVPRKYSSAFKKVRLFYTNPMQAAVNIFAKDTIVRHVKLTSSPTLEQTALNEKEISSLQLHFTKTDSFKVYGLSFEGSTGLYVDNMAMRGNSGLGLLHISAAMNTKFNSFQDYKLIVLQYGLNVVTENDSLGYNWYVDRMVKVVNRLKNDFPKASILLIGVSDRSSNQNGTFKTIPYIPIMRDAQRKIAQTCEIAFWDLYTAMGGENSMPKFVSANPPLASKDYTHLTFKGGKKIARQLAEALLLERERSVEQP